MKAYTDLEQSKRLAEILPIESADCYWDYDEMQKFHRISWFEDGYNKESQLRSNENNVCAWSLATLISVLPDTINGTYCRLTIDKKVDVYNISYEDFLSKKILILYTKYSLIDACYEMILKLHELKML